MNILLLSQFYPPIFGGEERHVRDLGIELAARGHRVAVATTWHPGMSEFETDQGVNVYRIPTTMRRAPALYSETTRYHAPSFPDPELVLGLRRVIKKERPEIVHAHDWIVYSFLPLKSWSGAKLVLSVHDLSVRCPTKTMTRRDENCSGPAPFKCLACATAHYGLPKGPTVVLSHGLMSWPERAAVDLYLPVSQAVKTANQLTGERSPVKVTPNFVRDDVGKVPAEPHPRLQELPDGDFILFVGAFAWHKGLNQLFRAYADLRNAPPLVVIGYTMPQGAMQTTHPPAGTIVMKDVPHVAVMQAWQRCMFGVVPSVWREPCPTTTIEAMAVGRPVIGTRIGGIPDQIEDGEQGLLVPPGDVPALAQAMQRLIDDPALRARLGDAAQRKAVEFQATSVVNRIEQSYRELVQSHGQAFGHATTRTDRALDEYRHA